MRRRSRFLGGTPLSRIRDSISWTHAGTRLVRRQQTRKFKRPESRDPRPCHVTSHVRISSSQIAFSWQTVSTAEYRSIFLPSPRKSIDEFMRLFCMARTSPTRLLNQQGKYDSTQLFLISWLLQTQLSRWICKLVTRL